MMWLRDLFDYTLSIPLWDFCLLSVCLWGSKEIKNILRNKMGDNLKNRLSLLFCAEFLMP